MAINIKTAKRIEKRCLRIGTYETALEEGVSEKTIERYVQLAQKSKQPEVVFDSVKELVKSMGDTNIKHGADSYLPYDLVEPPLLVPEAYLPDVCPTFRKEQLDETETSRVLVIGDLHTPFDYEPYFDHCCAVYDKYQCDRTIFIGDIIDNHYSSYHETDADGMGGGDELNEAINRLKRWSDTFPDADVTIGNHDRMVMRKAQSSSIPTRWIRDYKEVLGTPGWNFTDKVVYDGIQYIHGEGGTARSRCKKDLIGTVQGHLHTQCYTDWIIGSELKVLAMQVGCGIDKESYGMAYAKNFPNPAIACGVVLAGKVAINEVMSTS
jgi:hypothetical protein